MGRVSIASGRTLAAGTFPVSLHGMSLTRAPQIVTGYRPGLIGAVTALHARHYAETAGFGQAFEAVVATGSPPSAGGWTSPPTRSGPWSLAKKSSVRSPSTERIWAEASRICAGSSSRTGARRRICRRLLMRPSLSADARGHPETHLWTFEGLDAARRLYERSGFTLVEESPGAQWGREVREQRFVRRRGETEFRRPPVTPGRTTRSG